MKTTFERSDFTSLSLEELQAKLNLDSTMGLEDSLEEMRRRHHLVISASSPAQIADKLYRVMNYARVQANPMQAYWVNQTFIVIY